MSAFLHCRRWLAAGFAALAVQASAQGTGTPPDPEAARIQAIAEEAYMFGLPIVSNYALMYSFAIDRESSQFKAPFNQLVSKAELLTPADKAIPFPNNDTLYSTAWLDLRAEPMVITVPAIGAPRYYSVVMIDDSATNYGLIGSRVTGREAGDYLVVGPDWQGTVPKGIKQVFRAPTRLSLVVFRVQLTNAGDVDNVKAIQAGFQVRTLSGYAHTTPPPPAPAIAFPKIDRDLARANFFGYLDFALQFVPLRSEEQDIRAKLASIGIGSGKFDEFKRIAALHRNELMLGVKAAEQKIDQTIAAAGPVVNGWDWSTVTLDSDRAHYNGDYRKRAASFRVGPYGLNAAEAMYPMTKTLPSGEPLDGAKRKYTITFGAGQLPPVDAFWSLTIYDGTTRLFAENSLRRYLINSPMLPSLKFNADGSLTLYVQKDSPGADKEANWLPAPNGPIYLMLRLYGPKESVLTGQWQIPPVVAVD